MRLWVGIAIESGVGVMVYRRCFNGNQMLHAPQLENEEERVFPGKLHEKIQGKWNLNGIRIG